MKKLVVLSGAGISAESGISTFRDSNGLWEGHDIMEVATYEGWTKNPDLVLDFYNQRRKQLFEVEPNLAHFKLADLEKYFEVSIITQNVDNLHERAGSTSVLHLHGELMKSQSTANPNLVYDLDHWLLKRGDKCELGSQLRPFIVWFGESVPMIEKAIEIVSDADILVVIGTSLVVYPAAGLVDYTKPNTRIFVIDPKKPTLPIQSNKIKFIEKKAIEGMNELYSILTIS